MSRLLKILALSVIASVLMGGAFACNTMEGAGKDTKAAGEKLEDSANNNK